MTGEETVATVAMIASTTCFALGAYVLTKNPHLKSSRAFVVLAISATGAALLDLVLITAPGEEMAMLVARPLVIIVTLLAAAMLYLTSYLPYERKEAWLVRHRREYIMVAAVAAAIPAVLGLAVEEDRYGWWFSFADLGSWWWFATICAFYITGLLALARMHRRERQEDMRRRILVLMVGMGFPILSAVAVTPFMLSGNEVPPALSLTVLGSSLCFAYGIVRQRLFVLEPVREEVEALGKVPGVRPGRGVLVETKHSDLAYQMLINELASGGKGLVIARMHPDRIRERYGLRSTPMLWLTTKPGPDSIDPNGLTLLLHTAVNYLHKGSDSVVLLDGLEYLQSYNNPEAVMQFIYGLRDAIAVNGSKLIVAVDPEALGDWELPRLERELEPVKA